MINESSLKNIQEAQKLTTSALLELYEIDATRLGLSSVLRFYNGTALNSATVTFQGKEYSAFPIEVRGFEFKVKGELPRPSMKVANVTNSITPLVRLFDDLVGAKVIRHRTFARFLDDGIEPDPDAEFPVDIYYINRKSLETKEMIEFELGTSLEVENIRLPRRVISAHMCSWIYRSADCGYAENKCVSNIDNVLALETLSWKGEYDEETTYVFGDGVQVTAGDTRFVYVYTSFTPTAGNRPPNPTYWFEDQCSHRISSCKLRFDPNNKGETLPFGGFPGTQFLPEAS